MTAEPQFTYDHCPIAADQEHDPGLYRPGATAALRPSLDDIDDDAVADYHEHGYLAVAEALTPEEVADARRAIDALITGPAEPGVEVMYEHSAQRTGVENMTDDQKRAAVRKVAIWKNGIASAGLHVRHEALTRVVTKLMGGAAPEPFQVMALLKPAHGGREKPWHQDHAYFDLPLDTKVVGVWIALDPATVDNGCMQVLDGGHKLGPMHHWKRRDWQICDTEVMGRPSVAAPLPPGGALIFDAKLPHGTPTNHSPQSRWAMQFHYAPAGTTQIPTEDRLAVFGTEGKDVTC